MEVFHYDRPAYRRLAGLIQKCFPGSWAAVIQTFDALRELELQVEGVPLQRLLYFLGEADVSCDYEALGNRVTLTDLRDRDGPVIHREV